MIIATHAQFGQSNTKTSEICDYWNTYSIWQKRHKNIRNYVIIGTETINLAKATQKHQKYVIIGTHTQLGKSDTKTSEICDYWNTYSIWPKRHENIRNM